MDEVEFLRHWGGPGPDPSEASITVARVEPQRSIEALGQGRPAFLRRAYRQANGGIRKVAVLAGISTAAIMVQPHTPLGLPGHRALGWLSLLLMMRLIGGKGWATGVGLAAAVGTLAIGRSPNGSFWGVLQYVVAGIGIDAFLAARPQLAKNPLHLAALGALLLVLVGWITPISNSFVGGVPLTGTWVSMASVGASGWTHLLSSDLAFGAGAGVIGYSVAWVLNQQGRQLAARFGLRAGS
jgi:hypothetical protein